MKIGMLFSLSGPRALTERSILDGALLAVEQVNQTGGVAGEPVEAVLYDDRSEISEIARGVNHLCRNEQVEVLVGGYTSASRVAMRPAVATNHTLLMYPTYFEGEEADPNLFYCGATPNQYAADYLRWVTQNLGTRLYIVGSDYIYPRVLAESMRRLADRLGSAVVGDRYVPLGETEFSGIVSDIARVQPDVVLCNIVGVESTTAFYTQFAAAGFDSQSLPIAATVTNEIDLAHMPQAVSDGHYMVGTYFANIDSAVNNAYRSALQKSRGQQYAHPAQVGAYNAVHAVCLASSNAGPERDTSSLSRNLLGIRFDANPEGVPFYFKNNHYSSHPSFVVRAAGGVYNVVAGFPARLPEPWWAGGSSLLAVD